MKIFILGSGAAVPTVERGVSSVAVQIDRDWLLIDCGEGTQVQMQRHRIRWGRINHIFISHLHGDHFFGLPGLLFTYHLFNRKRALNIYSHAELQPIIESLLQTTLTNLSYPIVFHSLKHESDGEILNTKYFSVNTFPLVHRIASNGFLIKTKEGERRIKPEFLSEQKPDRKLLKAIQLGGDYEDKEGRRLANHEITQSGRRSASFAYISDSAYNPELAQKIFRVDLLYHEATFSNGEEELAYIKGHSTAKQAGMIANLASAGQLVLGHISPRTKSLPLFLNQALNVFPRTEIAFDGMVCEV